ncbi:hypothetical protein EST38_g12228 [Candolleomyces aberdarensis]|uniref:Actin n=1 Tax=Candolleomyces aberdarensis TaxID=2316362 RepID=A0A4Q2D2W5_9AGAR|nr:hypothetical protein EST38_g12228 [Candolleomyces aberdarensis]
MGPLGHNLPGAFVGDAAIQKRGILRIKYPVKTGAIYDFDDMEMVWNHVFMHELNVPPERQPVLLTDSPTNEKSNRERMAQVAFESLNINALNISSQSSLALYATGRITGVVLDSGEGVTHATAILNGVPIPEAVQKANIGGKVLADRFIDSLLERGIWYLTRREGGIARDILKQHGYVATNYHQEMQLDEVERPYKLPDGESVLLVGKERFGVPEALFQPSLHDLNTTEGVHSLVNICIGRANPGIQSQLYNNIVVAGGNTMFPGFVDRLEGEMIALAPANTTVSLVAPSDRHLATWKGGSILSSLSIFNQMLVTKEEYEEKGPSALHKRWF